MEIDLSALLAAALAAGLLLGGLITWFATRQAGGGRSAAHLKEELETYKRDVAAHYAETAKRVDALTKAYKDVYDHLEDGAYRLVGEEELRRRLDGGSEPVTLPGLGPRPLAEPTPDDAPPAGIGDPATSPAPTPTDDRAPDDAPGDAAADGPVTDDASSDAPPSDEAPDDAPAPDDADAAPDADADAETDAPEAAEDDATPDDDDPRTTP
ncbi:MAG: DUF1043 family protein [Trueperaceae bacterium]|nr:DUF1043 family protein [Trueperaceae bacterium]